MHDIHAPENAIDRELAESNELLGKECATCTRALRYSHFRKDSSIKDGRSIRCIQCENAPRMSTLEHTHRLREANFNSEAVRSQRWDEQEEYKNDAARVGRRMHHTELFKRLKLAVPNLHVQEGRIIGDLAVYLMYGQPQPDLGGMQFRYLFHCPSGEIPEYSLYEFDAKTDVPIREKVRGWRTVVLRLIKSDLLSERQAEALFGAAEGQASYIYRRELYRARNRKFESKTA